MSLFDDDAQNATWAQIAYELGGTHVPANFSRDKVFARTGPWTVALDSYTEKDAHDSIDRFTRFRTFYVSRGLSFALERDGNVLRSLGSLFGESEIRIGDPVFDDKYVIKGNDPAGVQHFFADPVLRQRILATRLQTFRAGAPPSSIFSKTHYLSTLPPGIQDLMLVAYGLTTNLDDLRNVFHLFAHALQRLCQMGAALPYDPGYVAR